MSKLVELDATYKSRFREAGCVYMATGLFLDLIAALVAGPAPPPGGSSPAAIPKVESDTASNGVEAVAPREVPAEAASAATAGATAALPADAFASPGAVAAWRQVMCELIKCLCALLAGDSANVDVFRGRHTRSYVLTGLRTLEFRALLLRLLQCMVAADRNQQHHDIAGRRGWAVGRREGVQATRNSERRSNNGKPDMRGQNSWGGGKSLS